MKKSIGTVVSTVHSIRKKAVSILAVFLCIAAANQNVHGQCTPTAFGVNQTPTVTGAAGAVNTQYRRNNVLPGVDMVMQIVSLNNGAILVSEDDLATPTSGYNNAWQPELIPSPTNTGDGGITWRISFFATGTSIPYRFNCLSLLVVDIDGNGSTSNPLKEFVSTVNPYSFAGQSTGTFLTYSATTNVVRSEASAVTTITNIDSTQKQGMSLFRYKNVSTFVYTTGYTKSVAGAAVNRQYSLFFNTQTVFTSAFSKYYDTDGDGVSDINDPTDLDDDNDGITDLREYPSTYADPLLDADGDGLANYEDPTPNTGTNGPAWIDINGDGVNDRYDIDLDGLINSLDLDADGDGIPDLVEVGGVDTDGNGTVDYTGTWASNDTDNDGLLDRYDASETNPNVVGVELTNAAFADGDGIPSFRDLDSDNDGIPDVVEAGGVDVNGDGRLDNTADADGDGLADIVDSDVGNDGIIDNGGVAKALIITGTYTSATVNTPVSYPQGVSNDDGRSLPNPYDQDSDDDGIADVTEAGGLDVDYDGKADSFVDTDGDGFNDSVDGDVGNDGVAEGTNKALLATGADTNGDG